VALSFKGGALEGRVVEAHDSPLVGEKNDRVPRVGESYMKPAGECRRPNGLRQGTAGAVREADGRAEGRPGSARGRRRGEVRPVPVLRRLPEAGPGQVKPFGRCREENGTGSAHPKPRSARWAYHKPVPEGA